MHCFSIYDVINIKREQAGNFGISNVERNYRNRCLIYAGGQIRFRQYLTEERADGYPSFAFRGPEGDPVDSKSDHAQKLRA